jgi:hypothetical protein
MDWKKGAFDSFHVEEAYSWRDDIMEITRQIVHETDEARLTNIAVHFEVDLSEIREFLESKRKRMGKPQTNADRIRAMTDEELAEFITPVKCVDCHLLDCGVEEEMFNGKHRTCQERVLDWLKQESEV